jgi:hypothetical protein
MGINVIPPKFPLRRAVSLTSGTSWTVPTGVKFVNVTLFGGGGGGGGCNAASYTIGSHGNGGEVQLSTLATTPGASIAYAIGAGGTGGVSADGGTGGTTTFTGATSAAGGIGGRRGQNNVNGLAGTITRATNGGQGANSATTQTGGAGASGWIEVEYWVA